MNENAESASDQITRLGEVKRLPRAPRSGKLRCYFWTVRVVDAAVPVSACTTTGSSPFAAPGGTCPLIWYTPAVPGTTPANDTVAGAPPTVTCGSVASGEATVGTTPGIWEGVVAPNPVP